jgi:hypothetical protein
VILEITPLPLPKQMPSIEQLLDGAVDALDALMADVRGGIRGPEHFDRLEAEATRIAGSLRDAFRKGARR